MKKILFYSTVAFISLFFVFSIVLLLLFNQAEMGFSAAAGFFLFATVFLCEAKFAFKPLKAHGVSNPVKGMFHALKKPQGYRTLCLILFFVFLLAGISKFSHGVVELLNR